MCASTAASVGRNDLRPTGVVELVAVVLRRVVAGRDDDACVGGGGPRRRAPPRASAPGPRAALLPRRTATTAAASAANDVGVPPGVVTDDHPRAPLAASPSPLRSPERTTTRFIRAGPGTQRRPQARGAEPQPPSEQASQLLGCRRVGGACSQERGQLAAGPRIGVDRQPGLRRRDRCCHLCRFGLATHRRRRRSVPAGSRPQLGNRRGPRTREPESPWSRPVRCARSRPATTGPPVLRNWRPLGVPPRGGALRQPSQRRGSLRVTAPAPPARSGAPRSSP